MAKLKESIPLIATAGWFLLVTVNVNQLLGLIYLAFCLLSMHLSRWDKVKTTPLDRTGKWFMPLFQGILIYVGFVLIASVLLPLFQEIELGKLLQLIATTTPALAESVILNTITFVLFVPFIETIFFVLLMDYFASKWNINISRSGLFRLSTIALVLGFSFAFLLLHITTKGITNNVALLLVFLMMVVTLAGAIWFGEAKQVIIFHSVANMFGIGLLASLTGVVALIVLIKISNKYNLKLRKWNVKL